MSDIARPLGARWAEPATVEALTDTLAQFAADKVDLLVIDGGDGTVRDVLSALPAAFGDAPPVLAILPSGKTNILALDLGAPLGWKLEAILARAATPVLKTRAPLAVNWVDGRHAPVRGFFFGLGGFVRATEMAQSVHRMGAFQGLAVALTLGGALIGTALGGRRDQWRNGVRVTMTLDDDPPREGDRLLTMMTTLKRLPLGLAPFGPPHEGMKVLDVDAPPRRLFAALAPLLAGRDAPWLAENGYRRTEAARAVVAIEHSVVIDGEVFPGGEMVVARGAPLRFLAS